MNSLNTTDAESVVVDFKIDRNDLFRAHLEVAKWRLIIGGVVTLVLALGAGYICLLVDEQDLWRAAPFFAAMPLVALAAQVLRLRAITGKYVSGLTEGQQKLHYVFPATGDGYNVTFGESFSHTAWNDIKKIVENSRFFLIYRNRFEIGLLPKSAFESGDIPTFRRILRSALAERAKLQPTN
jgi:hypothetical protein